MLTYVIEYLVSGFLDGSTESPLLPFPMIESRDADEDQILQIPVNALGIINPGTNNDGVYGNRFITWMIIRGPNVGVAGASVDIVDPRTTGVPIQQNIADLNGVAFRYIDQPFLLPQGSVIQVDGMTATPAFPIIVRLQVIAPETATEFLEVQAALCPDPAGVVSWHDTLVVDERSLGEDPTITQGDTVLFVDGAETTRGALNFDTVDSTIQLETSNAAGTPVAQTEVSTVAGEFTQTSLLQGGRWTFTSNANGSTILQILQPDSATDSGALINAAFAQLDASGQDGCVYLGPGTWLLDTSVQPLTGSALRGSGPATVLQWRNGHVGTNDATDRSLISIGAAGIVTGVEISDLSLNGNSANVVNTNHCIRINTSSAVRIRDVTASRAQEDGLNILGDPAVSASRDIFVTNCYFTNMTRDSVRLTSCQQVVIDDCISRDCTGRHFHIIPGDNEIVQRVFIKVDGHSTTSTPYSFEINASAESSTITDITIQGCSLHNQTHFGRITGSGTCNKIKVHGCTFVGNFSDAISAGMFFINGSSAEIEVHDNSFEQMANSGSGGAMILCSASSSEISIMNNRLTALPDVDMDGVSIGAVNSVQVVGNYINLAAVAIILTAAASNIVIEDNVAIEFTVIGLDASTATLTRSEFRNNHINSTDTTTTNGIRLSSRCVCTGNYVQIDGTGGAVGGAGILGASDCVVQGNTVRHGAAQYSIRFDGATTGYVVAENQVTALISSVGIPVRSANNDVIAV